MSCILFCAYDMSNMLCIVESNTNNSPPSNIIVLQLVLYLPG